MQAPAQSQMQQNRISDHLISDDDDNGGSYQQQVLSPPKKKEGFFKRMINKITGKSKKQ